MTDNILRNMEHLMFINKTLNDLETNFCNKTTRSFKKLVPVAKKVVNTTTLNENKTDFLFMKNNDQLFWCYYIIKYGAIKYESLLNNTFAEEQREKIQLVERLRNNKELLKKNKWKKNVIEGELVGKANISIITFICICTLNNLNISVINNGRLFSKIVDQSSEKNIIIKEGELYKLSILDRVEKEKLLEDYTEKCWVIDNIEKPLLTINSYKLVDLQNIANKLKIPIYDDDEKRYRKTDLYIMIKSKF
jgi:hypothetical protein